MRRTTAVTAFLFAALAIGGPFAGTAAAGGTTVRCAVPSPPAACALLDDLAAQLAPVASILPTDLADLVTPAQGFAARSDQTAGVPTAEVLRVSTSLREQLGALPGPVQSLLGAAVLDDLTGTLGALVAELTAPATDSTQSSSGTSKPTPAQTAPSTASSPGPRSSSPSSFGGSSSTTSTGGTASDEAVPDVPVGDPLLLAPLGMPDFGFDQSFEPAVEASIDAPTVKASTAALAEAVDSMSGDGRGAELAVVVVLSLLLIAGAGVAHLQAQRHTIPEV